MNLKSNTLNKYFFLILLIYKICIDLVIFMDRPSADFIEYVPSLNSVLYDKLDYQPCFEEDKKYITSLKVNDKTINCSAVSLYHPLIKPDEVLQVLDNNNIYIPVNHTFDGVKYFRLGDLNIYKYVFSFILIFIVGLLFKSLAKPLGNISYLVISFQFLFIIVPFVSLSAQNSRSYIPLVLVLLSHYILLIINRFKTSIKIPNFSKSTTYFLYFIFVFLTAYTIFELVIKANSIVVDFSEVYKYRAANESNTFFMKGYLLDALASVFLIFYVLHARSKNQIIPQVCLIVLGMSLYFITGFKAYLFMYLLIAFYLVINKYLDLRCMVSLVMVATPLLYISSWLFSYIWHNDIPIAMLERIFATPAALSELYYRFFNTYDYALGSGSKLEFIFDAPYTLEPKSLIAYYFWGYKFSPNVSWTIDAYSNFGYAGVLIYSLILGLFLKLADLMSANLDNKLGYELLFFRFAIAVSSSALPTALLTHSGFLSLLSIVLLSSILNNSCTYSDKYKFLPNKFK